MPQSLVQIYVHTVFSTKHRKPFLKHKKFREPTHGYLAGICKNLKSLALIVGGVEDHVHILSRLGKTVDVADLIRDLRARFVEVDQSRTTAARRVPLAARLRSVFGESVSC